MILIIGYGSFGRRVVNHAKTIDTVVVVDNKETVFDSVEQVDFKYIVGDATDVEVLKKAGIELADTIVILTNNPEINRKIAELVCELNPKAHKIVRGIPKYPDLYDELPIDRIIYPLESAAREVIKEIEKSKLKRKLFDLKNILIKAKRECLGSNNGEKEGNKEKDIAPLLIVTHNNPDPDAMASAMALKTIASKWDVEADIAYGGNIGFDENKAMINLLGIKMKHIRDVDLSKYCAIAVVDTSSSKNLPFDPETKEIDIVIDHHENGDLTARYMDVQSDVGATATILTEYLRELDISPSRDLATALFYAIASDTNYFKRKVTKKDFDAAGYLQGLIDAKTLQMIENPDMDTETMEVLAKAVLNRKIVKGNIALSYVGEISNRDALPRAADFLLRMEGITTTFVFGIVGDNIHISARTKDLRVDVGDILRKAFDGGGHQAAAAAYIPLGIFKAVSDKESLRKLVEEAIRTKIFEVMGIKEEEKQKTSE
ncbi:DHH family phosphoesterase [Methanotorris igneus]|uniref:TrkA-N domain protein n=1 Tax=Methanotorris igneus (strain DSM 5666 / JCM 11834 / Kol 5) TaxID=880724 RepID=F6BD21_METIK|nr:DHH family phosphoesterase [Methanotorris igneus]AEF96382.1 TrkA-N domain protein [Methanotorris igneus Kol 5]